ncbi:MAG: hypothetical protein V3V41_01625 [Candidatus Heimdallarchaeota archaeon]
MKIDRVKCPLLHIGDSITYEVVQAYLDNDSDSFIRHGVGLPRRQTKRVTAQVMQFKYDDNCKGCCENKPRLALAILSNKDVINPGNSTTVNCDECPLNKRIKKRRNTMIESGIKQQVVIESDIDSFRSKVNDLLFDGWQIIPGTFHVAEEEVLGEQTYLRYIIFLETDC